MRRNLLVLLVAVVHSAPFRVDVIYGEDDRRDMHEVYDERLLQAAKSIVLLFAKNKLQTEDNNYRLSSEPLHKKYNVCANERYAEQPSAGHCSGFLVAPDTVVTAGHCLYHISCEQTAVAFDFAYYRNDEDPTLLAKDKVYLCDQVIKLKRSPRQGIDFAVIKLKRAVRDRTPLALQTAGKIAKGQSLLVLGHPLGLPLKLTDQAIVRDNDKKHYFQTNTDTYESSSGSPVLHEETLQVEGIVVRGDKDFRREGDCLRSRVCSPQGCEGEDVVRSSVFATYIKGML